MNFCFEYSIIRSKRKTFAVSVNQHQEIKVRVPLKSKDKDIFDFIDKCKPWIEKKLIKFSNENLQEIKQQKYRNGDKILFLGKEFELKIITECQENEIKIDKNRIFFDEGFIFIFLKNYNNNEKENQKIDKLINKWLNEKAKIIFTERLNICFEIFIKKYKYSKPSLLLKRMKSTWGSLRNKKIVTLNSNLIYFATEYIDYIIFHELCHLKCRYHNKIFYNLQSEFVPNWKILKSKMKLFKFLK